MFQYVIKRLVYFIPTFIAISVITFLISKATPGDPVELRLQGGMQAQSGGQVAEKIAGEKAYLDLSEKMGLNLPAFYFSVTSQAYPDTLYRVYRKHERETLDKLINEYGNWPQIEAYYKSVKSLEYALFDIPRDSANYESLRVIREACNELYRNHENIVIIRHIGDIDSAANNSLKAALPFVNTVKYSYEKVKSEATPRKKYVPAFHWFGFGNQYHRWLFGDVPWFSKNDDPRKISKGFFRGDFGKSYLDGRPVASIIRDAIKWTMYLNIVAVLLAYLISIPVGVETAVRKDSSFDRTSTLFLFILYSLPSFWVATMLVVFITTPQYGMDWFPTYGVGSNNLPADASYMTIFWDRAYHFVLPVFCLTYGSFAFISRQMRGGMLTVIRQDYIRTAKAKGLGRKSIVWRHAFRNSLIPIITMFASLFPLMISGSVIIEFIFNIPGMGRVSYESVVARNYPVLYTILMFSAVLTMIGILVADLLYAFVDPRISYTKKR